MAISKEWLKQLNSRKSSTAKNGFNPHKGTTTGYASNRTTPKKSTSSSSRSTSTASTNVNSGMSSYSQVQAEADARAEAEAKARAEAERLRKQQEKIAQDSYNSNMSALQQAYDRKTNLLKQNFDTTKGTLGSTYNTSKGNVNAQSDKALQEAYVNRMLSQKNLAQNMAAQGISGGLSETTSAGLYNNYGNSRNNIEQTRSNNLTDLENAYQNNIASAEQQYNAQLAEDASAKAAQEIQLRSDLANLIANSYSDMYNNIPTLTEAYASQMQKLLANQSAYAPAQEAKATNDVVKANTESALDQDYSKYSNYLGWAKKVRKNNPGYTDEQIATLLNQNGVKNADAIAYILNQL